MTFEKVVLRCLQLDGHFDVFGNAILIVMPNRKTLDQILCEFIPDERCRFYEPELQKVFINYRISALNGPVFYVGFWKE